MHRRNFLPALFALPLMMRSKVDDEKEFDNPAASPVDHFVVLDEDGKKHRVLVEKEIFDDKAAKQRAYSILVQHPQVKPLILGSRTFSGA